MLKITINQRYIKSKNWSTSICDYQQKINVSTSYDNDDVILTLFFCRHATSLQNQLDQCSSLDIEVLVDEGDWSFGENIMKCLEEEGIVLFNIEDPQTSR